MGFELISLGLGTQWELQPPGGDNIKSVTAVAITQNMRAIVTDRDNPPAPQGEF